MTTTLVSIDFLHTSDAQFQSWATAFKTALDAIGLTQSSDTGQLDPTTATRPSSETAAGYLMYEPDDALTKPKYKFELGTGNSSNMPGIWLSVGWSTDGAGAFTGTQKSARTRANMNSSGTGATGIDCAFCHQDSALAICLNENAEGSGGIRTSFIIDRFRDVSDGSATADGVSLWIGSSNQLSTSGAPSNGAVHQVVPATGGVGAIMGHNGEFPGAYPRTSGTWGRGTNVGVAPLVPWDAGGLAPSIAAVFYSPTDAGTVGTLFTPSIYGVTRTYRAVYARADGNVSGYMAILYE